MTFEVVVLGTSWGGLAAMRAVLGELPSDFPVPIVAVQHRHRDSEHLLPSLLGQYTPLPVCEVEDKMPLSGGCIYVAPADYHLLVEQGFLSLSTEEPVRFSRPSIDVTFASAADSYGPGVIGVVLTGANADGAQGLRRIADRGGVALVQTPETSESPVMPAEALRAVPSARALSLTEIGAELVSLVRASAQAANH